MKSDNFYKVILKKSKTQSLETALFEFVGFLGVEEAILDESEIDEIIGEKAYCGGEIEESEISKLERSYLNNETLCCYFDSSTDLKKLEVFLDKKNYRYIIQKHDQEDWNENWKKSFQPILFKFFRVIPPWVKKESKKDVIINPAMGFGTGHHETTHLCLEWLEEFKSKKRNFDNCLDMGCGSGILGIIFHKLYKKNVTFCDIDKDSLDNCVENISLNFSNEILFGSEVVIRKNLKPRKNKYDLIFANILLPVILEESENLKKMLSTRGVIVISGILNEQTKEVLKAFKTYKFLGKKIQGDWTSLVLEKKL